MTRLHAYLRWLIVEPWVLIVTVAALILAVWACLWLGSTERLIRYMGAADLLVGTVYGLWALIGLRRLFLLDPFAEVFREWLSRRPRRRDITISVGTGRLTATGGSVEGIGWCGMGADLPLENRLTGIVANLEFLSKQAADRHQKHTEQLTTLRAVINQSQSAAESALADVSRTLRAAHIDGLWLAMAAVVFVILGTVLSAAASDLGEVHAKRAAAAVAVGEDGRGWIFTAPR